MHLDSQDGIVYLWKKVVCANDDVNISDRKFILQYILWQIWSSEIYLSINLLLNDHEVQWPFIGIW